MKTHLFNHSTALSVLLALGFAHSVNAQDRNIQFEAAAEALQRAAKSRQTEGIRRAAEKKLEDGSLQRAASSAIRRGDDPATLKKRAEDAAKMAALQAASSPQAQKLIAQSGQAPPAATPVKPVDAPAAEPQRVTNSVEPAGKLPQPTKNLGKQEDKGTIKVDATGAVFFDADDRIALFRENVEVDHPQFDMTSDVLEVFLGNDEEGGIKKAIATGGTVTIIKRAFDGKIQVAKCRKAIYEAGTGDVILRDNPQVQKGPNLLKSAGPTTYMILTNDGNLKTFGPTKTEIVKGKPGTVAN